MPVADYHMHTVWCGHAEGEMEEYVLRAIELGLPEIGFSPHLPVKLPIDKKFFLNREEMDIFMREFQRIQAASQNSLPIRLGGEADYLPGNERHFEKMKQEYGLEYLIGSVHFIGSWPFDHPDYLYGFFEKPIEEIYREYFDLVAQAAQTGIFDIIGHLDLPKKFGHKPEGGIVPLAEKAIRAIADNNVAIEINTAGKDKRVHEFYPEEDLLIACREAGIRLTFGSDAHAPQEVGRYFDDAAALAKSAGFTRTMRLDAARSEVIID